MNERSEYPETRLETTRTVVIVFEDEMTDEAMNQLEYIELAEMEINFVRGFDNNVKVIAEVPDSENIEAIKEYWKEAINEVLHPCCSVCDDGKFYDEDGNEVDVQIPEVYEVKTMSEFIKRDMELNPPFGQYANEFTGIKEIN